MTQRTAEAHIAPPASPAGSPQRTPTPEHPSSQRGQILTVRPLRAYRGPDPDLEDDRAALLALAREQFRVLENFVVDEIGGALRDGAVADALAWIEDIEAQLARLRETLRHAA